MVEVSGENWRDFLAHNLGKLIGVTLGLVLGWMIIEYGLIKTLFVVILISIGYIFGKQLDDGGSLSSIIDRIFRR